MKPDPFTKEGREEIRKILEKRKEEAQEAKERSEIDIENEPVGKLTNPNELDIRKDRMEKDERKG